jgi:undecaprenyl diphosphate synthase
MSENSLPNHVAIIMDGNGRWATSRGKNRTYGHYIGSQVIDEIARFCVDKNIHFLTLYTFSTENWKRPASEVKFLMSLLRVQMKKKSELFETNSIKFNVIGDLSAFDNETQIILKDMIEKTKHNDRLTLTLALNYGSKLEITNALRNIAKDILNKKIAPNDITENLINKYLYTNDMPDVDLLIRTGGEKRISNFLLWQLSYAEFIFFDKYWPDFNKDDMHIAIDEFKNRKRRFGGL